MFFFWEFWRLVMEKKIKQIDAELLTEIEKFSGKKKKKKERIASFEMNRVSDVLL